MVSAPRLVVAALIAAIAGLAAAGVGAQTREVRPGDLSLSVTLERRTADLLPQEMILLTIEGVYKRHITLEKLVQPDLAGLNWMQLGQDYWFDSTVDGVKVKNFRRRMALFPEAAGSIVIGSFEHRLHLTDERDAWFEHTIRSEPVTLTVAPAPEGDAWWFPVRSLKVEDRWSNAPDQLKPGEGVLRIIRVSALGARPDMIPPMPELRSPSALVFPHPEKRLVDLTPEGPVAVAFWRWTIRPTNDISAILEPVEVPFFDAEAREPRKVVISAQRVAYLPEGASGEAAEAGPREPAPPASDPAPRRRWPAQLLAALVFLATVAALIGSGRSISARRLKRAADRTRLLFRLRLAARRGDLAALRRTARALDRASAPSLGRAADRAELLAALDDRIFGASPGAAFDARAFAARFAGALGPVFAAPPDPTGSSVVASARPGRKPA